MATSSTYGLLALAALAALASADPVFNYGHAAYVYGPLHCTGNPCDVVPSCNEAHWAKDIAAFNRASPVPISTVLSYGGDPEFWADAGKGKTDPHACHAPADQFCNFTTAYDPNNRKAAGHYAATEGVKQVVALIDGRLDGWDQIMRYNGHDACHFGDFYPNLNNLTYTQVDQLAHQTASLYCKDDNLGGVQVDLEPYKAPYTQKLEHFINKISMNMEDVDSTTGCRNAKHPEGRTTSFFTFAHAIRDDFKDTVLGKNGYFVFSGYDLNPIEFDPVTGNEPFKPNSPEVFRANLMKEIPEIKRAIGSNGKFSIALPLGASCHEYEQYSPMHGDGCGPACEAYDSGAKMKDYVQVWMDVLNDPQWGDLFKLREGGQFLGVSLWSWSYDMTYPPMRWFNNRFLPASPPADTLDVLMAGFPKMQQ
jgi:hypothetical protein